MRIGIVGSTGLLGRELVTCLAEKDDDWRREILDDEAPTLFATGQSAGEVLPWVEDEELPVEVWGADAARGLDIVLLATPPAAAPPIISRLRELGVLVLDASRSSRGAASLYFSELPRVPQLAGATLLALPSPESLALARLIVALERFLPRALKVAVLKAAASAGNPGLKDLAEATGRLLNGQEPETPLHGHRLAFNLVPQLGAFSGEDTEAELDLKRDLPQLTGQDVQVQATVAMAPWFHGDFVVGSVELGADVSTASVRGALTDRPHVKVVDDPAQGIYPMPSLVAGDDSVLVGRLRVVSGSPRVLQFVAASDGTRASAAHALEALEALVRARRAH